MLNTFNMCNYTIPDKFWAALKLENFKNWKIYKKIFYKTKFHAAVSTGALVISVSNGTPFQFVPVQFGY
jgi:hypothetical protein